MCGKYSKNTAQNQNCFISNNQRLAGCGVLPRYPAGLTPRGRPPRRGKGSKKLLGVKTPQGYGVKNIVRGKNPVGVRGIFQKNV